MQISIVILSYNQFEETTKPCLQSLAEDPDFSQWEILIVDNASDAKTRTCLESAKRIYPSVRFILNEKNVGVAAGNNIGIAASTGDVVILLNSDTICPEGMIARLTAHCDQSLSPAMVGPVTNAAGNEQGICTTASDVAGKIQQGLRYANSGSAESLTAYRLDFFCVAITRQALDKIGPLDERFGRGYYEDFDYSLRAKRAGLRIVIAEDAFIYHRGSASFSKMPDDVRTLLKRNKQLIREKHGANVLFPHAREGNISVLAQYAKKRFHGEEVPEYRVANRIQRAINDQPKGWFKRWGYMRRVHALARQFGMENNQ